MDSKLIGFREVFLFVEEEFELEKEKSGGF